MELLRPSLRGDDHMFDVVMLKAAAILVGAGEATYEILGVTFTQQQSHLRSSGEARGRNLKYCSREERVRTIEECKHTLGVI